jgi:hypothetical protein
MIVFRNIFFLRALFSIEYDPFRVNIIITRKTLRENGQAVVEIGLGISFVQANDPFLYAD